MNNAFAIDLAELLQLSVPLLEIVVRGTVMFWFLFLVFRFVVRRDVGAVGIGDLLILVIVADAAQNAMAGEANTIGDGMVLVATLIGWNVLLDWISYRFSGFRRFAEPRPLRLVSDGRILRRNMRRELITDEELLAKLRADGIESLEQVKDVYMEADGRFSIIKRDAEKTGA
jgi:uncharacterized membrane protein YcaP (DUF421 family)